MSGAAVVPPVIASSTIRAIAYFGFSQGANAIIHPSFFPECLRPISAVPVFPAARAPESGPTGRCLRPIRSHPACRPGPVEGLGRPTQHIRNLGSHSRKTRAPLSCTSNTNRGLNNLPPLATAATANAICNGVTVRKPCPIEMLQVSPSRQPSPNESRFHPSSGNRPEASESRAMPVGFPNPIAAAM